MISTRGMSTEPLLLKSPEGARNSFNETCSGFRDSTDGRRQHPKKHHRSSSHRSSQHSLPRATSVHGNECCKQYDEQCMMRHSISTAYSPDISTLPSTHEENLFRVSPTAAHRRGSRPRSQQATSSSPCRCHSCEEELRRNHCSSSPTCSPHHGNHYVPSPSKDITWSSDPQTSSHRHRHHHQHNKSGTTSSYHGGERVRSSAHSPTKLAPVCEYTAVDNGDFMTTGGTIIDKNAINSGVQQPFATSSSRKNSTGGKLMRPPLEGEDNKILRNDSNSGANSTTASPAKTRRDLRESSTLDSKKPPLKPLPLRNVTRPDGRSPENVVSEATVATPCLSQASLSPSGLSPYLEKSALFPDNKSLNTPSESIQMNDFEYDDYDVTGTADSYFAANPPLYTLTWSTQPDWLQSDKKNGATNNSSTNQLYQSSKC